jgi:FGGY-family pentulose kinase
MTMLLAAVDVGTGSARAGILDASGKLLARREHPIAMHQPAVNHAEHDSEQIWAAVSSAVRGAVAAARLDARQIGGISFDATCSLVVRDPNGLPVSVSTSGLPRWDTIVWLDHRALAEAEECTNTGHRVLEYIGGVMSPEMETPKLMWLKRHLPSAWAKAGYFFDLADFLTWKASGAVNRSQCTLTCKWTYLGHEKPGWQNDFLRTVGIHDMLEQGQVPATATPIGTDIGALTGAAAADLGLTTSCRVGTGLIDAHAGTLGVLGWLAGSADGIDRHLALIAGTSSCAMALSHQARPTPGVWGPYYGAVLPNCWLNEGGQSATGALLDHMIRLHGAGGEPNPARHQQIVARIMQLRENDGINLAPRLHVLPDFHGNRSPLADPYAVGVISGLTLDSSFDSLCQLYWRTAVGIALGVRHILSALNAKGFKIDTLHVTGGHTKNPLLMELYADATNCTVIEPLTEDSTLLGTAMVAATAARAHPTLSAACAAMRQASNERRPNPSSRPRFDRDYEVFLAMHRHRKELETIG